MSREDIKLYRKIWKAAEKETHRSADEFHPHYLTVDGLSEKVGHPEYARQVKNRLWAEIEAHEEYMDYTMIDFNHPDDLCITAEGITAFSDILSCYFDPEALADVAEYMHRLDEIERSEMRERQIVRAMPTSILRKFIEEYRASGAMAGLKMDDGICALLTDELASRSPLNKLKESWGI